MTTAITTTLAIITMMGMLWAGTSLNQGYEAPQMLIIPTVWAAAAIAALALTTAFACLIYIRSSRPQHDEPPSPDTGTDTSGGSGGGVGETRMQDRPRRGRGGQGPSIQIGGGNSSSGQDGGEQTRQRAKENFPDRMSEEGNEHGGQSTQASQEAVPTSSPETEVPDSRSAIDSNAWKDGSSESGEDASSERSIRSGPHGESSAVSDASADAGGRSESDEPSDDVMPKSYYRTCRNQIIRSEFKRQGP